MTHVRRIAVVGFAVVATVLGVAGLAWACTPQAYLEGVQPQGGPAGSTVTVKGSSFAAEVEIRWDSAEGHLLAIVPGPSFTAQITIPDAAKRDNYIVAISRDPANPSRILGRSTQPFTVTGPAPATDPTDPGQGSVPAPGQTTTGAAPAPTSSAATASSSVAPVLPTATSAAPNPGAVPEAGDAPVGGAAAAPAATPVGARSAGTAAPAARATAGALQAPAANVNGAGAGSGLAPGTPGTVTVAGEPERLGSPSARTAGADVWSGFSSTEQAQGLADRQSPAPTTGSGLGWALVALGLVALGGTAGVALRRRTQRVQA